MDSICILHILEVFRGFPRGSGAILEVRDFHFFRFLLSENRTQFSVMNHAVLGPWTGTWGIWTKFQGLFFFWSTSSENSLRDFGSVFQLSKEDKILDISTWILKSLSERFLSVQCLKSQTFAPDQDCQGHSMKHKIWAFEVFISTEGGNYWNIGQIPKTGSSNFVFYKLTRAEFSCHW